MINASTQDLQFHLTFDQSSLLLEALMEQPFKKVFEIIGLLNQQAQQFYQSTNDKNRAQLFVLAKSDFTICIKSLGELPYNRVNNLIQNLHQQLHAQLLSVPENSSARNMASSFENNVENSLDSNLKNNLKSSLETSS